MVHLLRRRQPGRAPSLTTLDARCCRGHLRVLGGLLPLGPLSANHLGLCPCTLNAPTVGLGGAPSGPSEAALKAGSTTDPVFSLASGSSRALGGVGRGGVGALNQQ